MTQSNVIIIGAGGHAKVLLACLLAQANVKVIGLLDNDSAAHGKTVLGFPVLGGDDKLRAYAPASVQLVNGVGSIDIPSRRQAVFQTGKTMGYTFFSVIHAAAVIDPSVRLAEGVQIMAGAIVQPDCQIGANVLLNTGASIDHDTAIADHVHIAPGATVSGNVRIATLTHIGVRAVILQGLQIGQQVLVGAGAVVVDDIAAHSRVVGVPARPLQATRRLTHE